MLNSSAARKSDFRRARDQVQAMNAAAREDPPPVWLTHADIERAVAEFAPILPGWALFPVVGKVPVRGLAWTERASADPVERAALAALEHDGWAVACGPSGLCVLDLDTHHESADGIASWCAFMDAHGMAQNAGNARIVGATPSGGRHLYYANSRGIGNRVGVLPGVDVRGVGGYVVLSGPGRMLTMQEWTFPPLPSCLLDLLTSVTELPRPTGSVPRASVVAALGAACDMVASASEGGRNALLNWAAFVPGREAIREGAPRESVEAVLLDAARECGLSDREALATIRSGLGAAR